MSTWTAVLKHYNYCTKTFDILIKMMSIQHTNKKERWTYEIINEFVMKTQISEDQGYVCGSISCYKLAWHTQSSKG